VLEELGWDDITLWLGSEKHTAALAGANDIERAAAMAASVQDLLTAYFSEAATSPDSFVVFYYAGHGFLSERRDRGYLAFPLTQEAHPVTAIAMDFIVNDLVLDTSAQRVVAVLDCCHSGAAFRRFRARSSDKTDALLGYQNVQRLTEAQVPADDTGFSNGKAVLTSCRANEIVPEDEAFDGGFPTGQSVFSYTVCDGWQGAATMGVR
jgi:uncharacterized caspase-like protein